jgi:hypothetical protein
MRIAVCDQEAFYPLRSLVAGPLMDLNELNEVERLIRTVVLHDEISMELEPIPYEPEAEEEFTEEEKRIGGRNVIVALGSVLDSYDFFMQKRGLGVKPALLTRERVGHGVMGMCAWGHVVMARGTSINSFIYFGTIQAERARGQVLLFDILFTMGNNRGMKGQSAIINRLSRIKIRPQNP